MKIILWEDIYRRQAPILLGLCRRYVNDLQKAEDLVHDAFLAAIGKQQTFSGMGAVEAWLRKITLNTVLQYLRREKKLLELAAASPALSADEISGRDIADTPVERLLDMGFDQADLIAALDLLPEHHRTAFNLYVFEGFSHQQIAEALGVSVGTSKSHLARARKKIQSILLQKAADMQKKEKKARIFFLPVPDSDKDEAFIDQLYRNALSDHRIAPEGGLDQRLAEALKQAPPVSSPYPAFVSFKMLALSGALALCICTVVWRASKPRLSETRSSQGAFVPEISLASEGADAALPAAQETVQTFSAPLLPEQRLRAPAKKDMTDAPALPPVVVRKTVVKKDTVYQFMEHGNEQ